MENQLPPIPNEKQPISLLQHPIEWSDEAVVIADSSAYRSIWYSPIKTFQRLLRAQNSDWVMGQTKVLFVVGGIIRSLDRIDARLTDAVNTGISAKIPFAIVSGALFGWIIFVVYAGMLCWTGNKLLGKHADERDYKIIVAWSIVPLIAASFFTLLRMIVFDRNPSFELLSLVAMIPEVILEIWAVVLLVRGIKLIQTCTTFKAILNILLPGMLFIAVVLGVKYLFEFTLGSHIAE